MSTSDFYKLPLTVEHILVVCSNLQDICEKYFVVSSIKQLVVSVNNHGVITALLSERMRISAHVTDLSPSISVGLCVCVCLSGKCTVAKRLIGSRCRLGW